ncbi:unnamed protein product, partial [Scytosiphon promiscuus]
MRRSTCSTRRSSPRRFPNRAHEARERIIIPERQDIHRQHLVSAFRLHDEPSPDSARSGQLAPTVSSTASRSLNTLPPTMTPSKETRTPMDQILAHETAPDVDAGMSSARGS